MKKLYTILLLTLSLLINAQNPGDIAQSFGKLPGFNNNIWKIATQADGKILVGGEFTTYSGGTENKIIRLNTDGTKDSSFNTGTGFNNTIYAIATQADGKILVGGQFTTYNGGTENKIIRLNTDGTKDSSFNIGTGFNYSIYVIETQTDGKILVGGQFTTYNGGTENQIIRLNTDGTEDSSFNIGTGFNNFVYAIETQADGKILVGGNFTSYNGSNENYIIRLNTDGTKDSSFNSGIGFNSSVNVIKTLADGKILVGGSFTMYKGDTENQIIRLNIDGTKDSSFNTGIGFNSTILAIEIQTDDKIVVGGQFTTYKGGTENRIIRLNTDGTKDYSFNAGTGFNYTVLAMATQTDGKILVGGGFTTYNRDAENYFIRLNTNGAKDSSFNTGTGFNYTVLAIATQTDGKILVGGFFTKYKGVTENRIIRLNTDGTKDTTFNTGAGFNNTVRAISLEADGKILVVGNFTSYDGVAENRIIRLNTDGTKDYSFNAGTGFDNPAYAIAIQADGKILVGGNFTSYDGVAENRIIRLNTDGTNDSSFITGAGFDDSVQAIIVQADGKILVGGNFTSYNGGNENYIIRLNTDGTKDYSFNAGTGFNSTVYTITTQTDTKIVVGGNYTSYNGGSENYIIRLNTDGTKDSSFNTGTGFNSIVYAIETQADGKILLGGNFSTYNGIAENRIIRLNTDGTKDSSFNAGTGFNSTVYAITLQADGKILVRGNFSTYKGDNSSANLIGLHTEASLGTTSFTDTNSFVVYPNPVNDVLHFQSNEFSLIKAIKIYDLQGKLILEVKNNTINVSNLSKGLYLVKILTGDREFTKKIIKE